MFGQLTSGTYSVLAQTLFFIEFLYKTYLLFITQDHRQRRNQRQSYLQTISRVFKTFLILVPRSLILV